MVSYKDTEKLVSRDSPSSSSLRNHHHHHRNGVVYTSSSRCCKTRTSIIASKVVFVLLGVASIVVGAVLAGTMRHPVPTGCDDAGNSGSNNCSLVCQSQSTDVLPMPTRTSHEGVATPLLVITPSLTVRTIETFIYSRVTATPSPSPLWLPSSGFRGSEGGITAFPVIITSDYGTSNYSSNEAGDRNVTMCLCDG